MTDVFDPGGEASGYSFRKSDHLAVASPVGERCQAPFPAKGSRQSFWVGKTGCRGHLGNRQIGIGQQPLSATEPGATDFGSRTSAEQLDKTLFESAPR